MFMLAEDEGKPELCKKAFDMNYGWGTHSVMHNVAQGKDSVSRIISQVMRVDSILPKNAMQMNFITNHDENSWNGTAKEKFGAGENAFAVLSYTLPGMPLIYSGQEAGLAKRLRFFAKDTIDWKAADFSPFYKTLNALKHDNEALWNAPYGGMFAQVKNTVPAKVVSFIREKGDYKILVVLNLSAAPVSVAVKGDIVNGTYTDVFTGNETKILKKEPFDLEAWGYKVLEIK
jgi:1,4-alpha-glucan branching enzyme